MALQTSQGDSILTKTNQNRMLIYLIGASKGYGRALAIEGAKLFAGSTEANFIRFAFAGRDMEAMKETGELIVKNFKNTSYSLHKLDVADVGDDFDRRVDEYFRSEANFSDYNAVYLVHNSGWAQPAKFLFRASTATIKRSVELNFTSFIAITARFLVALIEFSKSSSKTTSKVETSAPKAAFSTTESAAATASLPTVRIIQISSGCGVSAMPAVGVYCSVKAGRDMLTKCVDLDVKESQILGNCNFKTLSWAPGAMETDMLAEFVGGDLETLGRRPAHIVHTDESAHKLWKLIASDEYNSGSHVDVHDVKE